jgi:hypothetical protein
MNELCPVCRDTGKWKDAPQPCPHCRAVFVPRDYMEPPIPLYPRVVDPAPLVNRKDRRRLKVVK